MIWNMHVPLEPQLDALHSNDLLEALHVAVRYHHTLSIVLILSRLVKEDRISNSYVLGYICCLDHCKTCWEVRRHVFHYLIDRTILEKDMVRVRNLIRTARLNNTFAIQRHHMLLHPTTDIVTQHILQTAHKNWTKATAVVFAVLMWNAWKRRQLHPDSRYVKGLAVRFRSRC
jgi:hypothetical protein